MEVDLQKKPVRYAYGKTLSLNQICIISRARYVTRSKIKNLYECLSPKNIEKLKPWDTVHVDLVGQYRNSIRQHHKVGATIKNYISFTCMMIIDPTTGWFEISEVTMFDIDEVMAGNDEYIDK